MPCKKCSNGSWECGTNGALLCKPGEGWKVVGNLCFAIYTRKDKDGNCQVKIKPADCDCGDKALPARRKIAKRR
ncbi:MAG: hypothetical protein JNJ80_14770 [Gemmatimonadetes bacterium]|nr:hypothetical protein [Gemmatimonadota bacterium]MCC7131696.1 hypothetical protein [Gemmatimonadales bacterium]